MFQQFWQHTDVVGLFLFVLLMVLSLWSWFIIVKKTAKVLELRKSQATFLSQVKTAKNLTTLTKEIGLSADLARVLSGLSNLEKFNPEGGVTRHDLYSEAMEMELEEQSTIVEHGLSVLGSVAATAPFIGLFGTVWGVYHALVSIGSSGQATLDQVAGPVGEALIMTGLGLAVAVPAVLAYNAFNRQNRLFLQKQAAITQKLLMLVAVQSQH